MTEVYSGDIQVVMRAVPDEVGLPHTTAPFELAGPAALIEILEGPPGGPGPQGDPAWPWIWQGDIADFAALEALPLGHADKAKAWRNVDESAVYYWTGEDWIRLDDAFLTPGPQGPPAVLTGVAESLSVGASATAAITGTAPNQTLTVRFPRGATGDTGDAGVPGAIADAADVAGVADARDGAVLAWDAAADVWRPRPAPRLLGPWAIAGAQFSAQSNISEPSKVIATMTIPAQPLAWRPIVIAGQINIKVHAAAVDDTRVIAEVRLGSAAGPVIGFAFPPAATNNANILFVPRWETALTPDSTHATVAPNQTATLYVVMQRVSGTRTYTLINQGAQLVVMAQPLKDQP